MKTFSSYRPSVSPSLLLCALVYALSLVFITMRLSVPSDAARQALGASVFTESAVTVYPIVEYPTGLRGGDSVLRVDGQDLILWTRAIFTLNAPNTDWRVGDTITYTVLRNGSVEDVPVLLRPFPIGTLLEQNGPIAAFLLLVQGQAIWMWRKGRGELGAQPLLLASAAFVSLSICWYIGMDLAGLLSSRSLFLFYRIATCIQLIVVSSAMLHFAIVLPGVGNRLWVTRRLILAIYTLPFPSFVLYLFAFYSPDPLMWLRRWELGIIGLIFVAFVLAIISLVTADRRIHTTALRSRIRFVAAILAVALAIAVGVGMMPIVLTGHVALGWQIVPLLSLPVVLGFAAAVVFHRLFDIRVVIQRTLVWTALTTLIIAIYVLVVGMLGTLFHARGSPIFSLIATGISAAIFNTVRVRLQSAINWLLYGERDSPYQVVTRLSRQLEETLVPDDALDQIATIVGTALKLPYTAIELVQDREFFRAASWGEPTEPLVSYPLTFDEETVGRLLVAQRTPDETLTPGDHQLISGLLYHAESVIKAARLTRDLQRAREKLVLAREEERRRLRRELHDGVGSSIAALILQIEAARNLLADNPAGADTLLADVKTQTRQALEAIRHLVYELHPPALEELGLKGAIVDKAQQLEHTGGLSIEVDIPQDLPSLSAAAEVAIYRICVEALTNVSRHSKATQCTVRLTHNHVVSVEICDNGQGLPRDFRRGVGMNSMRERAAELGGTCVVECGEGNGLRVLARIPLVEMPRKELADD